MKSVISIKDRKSNKEVLYLEKDCKVTELRKSAMTTAIANGFGDLLSYEIWVGSEKAYKEYRLGGK